MPLSDDWQPMAGFLDRKFGYFVVSSNLAIVPSYLIFNLSYHHSSLLYVWEDAVCFKLPYSPVRTPDLRLFIAIFGCPQSRRPTKKYRS